MQKTLAQQRQVSRSCSFRCDLSENHRPFAKTQGTSLQTHTADPLLGVPISVPIFVPIFCSDFFCCCPAEKLQKKIRNKNQNKNQGGTFPQQIWTPIDRVAYTWMQVLVWVRYSHQWLSTLVTVSKLTLSLRLLLNVSLTECAQQFFMNSIFMDSIQNFWSQKKSETNLCRNAAARFLRVQNASKILKNNSQGIIFVIISCQRVKGDICKRDFAVIFTRKVHCRVHSLTHFCSERHLSVQRKRHLDGTASWKVQFWDVWVQSVVVWSEEKEQHKYGGVLGPDTWRENAPPERTLFLDPKSLCLALLYFKTGNS